MRMNAHLFAASLVTIGLLPACGDSEATTDDSDAEVAEMLAVAGANVIHPARNGALCMDVAAGSTANGTPVQLARCNGGPAQAWTFSSGSLRVFGNKCLDVRAGVNADRTPLQIWDCRPGNRNQQFTERGNTFVAAGGRCVDVPGNILQDGAPLQIYACNGSGAQAWSSARAGGGEGGGAGQAQVLHAGANNGLCLDVAAANRANGTPVQIAVCNGNSAQTWTLTGGTLRVFGNKCLDVPGGVDRDGTRLQIWDCRPGNANQQWVRQGRTLVWAGRGKCVDIPFGVAFAGARVQIAACSSNIAQVWNP
jgi:hypothetical protein